jgi:hypothetical protein
MSIEIVSASEYRSKYPDSPVSAAEREGSRFCVVWDGLLFGGFSSRKEAEREARKLNAHDRAPELLNKSLKEASASLVKEFRLTPAEAGIVLGEELEGYGELFRNSSVDEDWITQL